MEINTLVTSLGERLREALGEKVEGLYVYGSLACGDFDPGVSDIDMLAVMGDGVTDEELARLREMHRRFAEENPEWAGRIEVQYVSRAALQTFRERPSTIANISPGEPLHFIEAGRDWLMNWYFVLDRGVTLFGPPPTEFIPPISNEEFVAEARNMAVEYYGKWAERELECKAQAYVCLTMCRALYTIRTGNHASKKKAARWFTAEFPEWSALIERAFEWRSAPDLTHINPATTMPETRRFIRFVLTQIAE